jgi:hypothetical protein
LLGLLQKLFSCPELDDFVLVGGTALSLRIGSRKSIDIDLFTTGDFPGDMLSEFLGENSFNFK